jgi:hypothetical protein
MKDLGSTTAGSVFLFIHPRALLLPIIHVHDIDGIHIIVFSTILSLEFIEKVRLAHSLQE